MTNVLPGRLARFGLDVETLAAERPGLILARMGGFSASGPQADDPGFDQTAFFALSGLMDQQRDPDSSPGLPAARRRRPRPPRSRWSRGCSPRCACATRPGRGASWT